MITDLHKRCVCGYRRFSERVVRASAPVQRWLMFDYAATPLGVGSIPFGTSFGGGGSLWGKFEGTYNSAVRQEYCESCQRLRSSSPLSGIAIFGAYLYGGRLYVVASDVSSIGCLSLRFDGERSYTVSLKESSGDPLPLLTDPPLATAYAPTPGEALADVLLYGRLPEVPESGEYTVVLVDRCSGYETTLVTLELEAPPMLINPNDAYTGDFPTSWMHSRPERPLQPGADAGWGLPFDKCDAVLEYDARFGTLPSAQGWSYSGTLPDPSALVEGGVLGFNTPGGGATGLWSADLVMAAPPTSVYVTSSYLVASFVTPSSGFGDGLYFEALRDQSAAAARGIAFNQRFDNTQFTNLDLTGDQDATYATQYSYGFHAVAAAYIHADLEGEGFVNRVASGRQDWWGAGAVSAQTGLSARFGELNGLGFDAYIRNYVASANGRFVRPLFRVFTQVSDPVLRLYFYADSAGGGVGTARFKMRYGVGINTDPFLIPTNVLSSTLTVPAPNTLYELSFALPGLVANAPVWFTLEREWDHGDDTMASTVWLAQATIRTS